MDDKINDGGPAFPRTVQRWNDSLDHVEGMSLRDWFAGQALQGVASGFWSNSDMSVLGPRGLAESAYEFADAMLAARAKRGGR